jgi:hypothetical protein
VSRWSRVCRWQAGMATGWSAVGVYIAILIGGFIMTKMANEQKVPMIGLFAWFSSIMPAALAGGALLRRRKLLPRESLICADRATYLRQVGMAAALNQLQLWLGMIAVFMIWWCWICPQPLSATMIEYVLAFSALSQPWLFGAGVWLLRFQSRIPLILGWGAAAQMVAFAMIGVEPGAPSVARMISLLVAAILALLGLVLTWHAYRRWLAADFD